MPIHYFIYLNNQSVAVDNEEVEEMPIYLHDSWGKCVEKEESISVIWEDTEFIYAVRGPIEEKRHVEFKTSILLLSNPQFFATLQKSREEIADSASKCL